MRFSPDSESGSCSPRRRYKSVGRPRTSTSSCSGGATLDVMSAPAHTHAYTCMHATCRTPSVSLCFHVLGFDLRLFSYEQTVRPPSPFLSISCCRMDRFHFRYLSFFSSCLKCIQSTKLNNRKLFFLIVLKMTRAPLVTTFSESRELGWKQKKHQIMFKSFDYEE